MNKLKLARRAMLPAVAAIAAVGLGTSAALAQTTATYTITAGSATSADSPVSFTANTTGDVPQVHFSDIEAGLDMTCTSGAATGTVKVGTGLPNPLAGIAPTWSGCQGLGLDLTVTAQQTPWSVNGDGSTDVNGVTQGYIDGVHAHVVDTLTGGSICSFDVEGSASGSYSNGSQDLTVSETGDSLLIENPGGTICGGALLPDDHATYDATYHVVADNPDYNPIAINSES